MLISSWIQTITVFVFAVMKIEALKIRTNSLLNGLSNSTLINRIEIVDIELQKIKINDLVQLRTEKEKKRPDTFLTENCRSIPPKGTLHGTFKCKSLSRQPSKKKQNKKQLYWPMF